MKNATHCYVWHKGISKHRPCAERYGMIGAVTGYHHMAIGPVIISLNKG